jgi:hypothetical protein
MPVRFLFTDKAGLSASITAKAPSAVITTANGTLEAIVSDAEAQVLDRALPAAPLLVGAATDNTTALTVPVRADLLNAVDAIRGSGTLTQLRAALTQLFTDARARQARVET